MKEAVAGHLTGCTLCAKKLEALDNAMAMFHMLSPDTAPVGFELRLEKKLRELGTQKRVSASADRFFHELLNGISPFRAMAAAGFASLLVLTGVLALKVQKQTVPDRYMASYFSTSRPYYNNSGNRRDLLNDNEGGTSPTDCRWSSCKGDL
jgi:anti-sigma factor RsiW